jgi:hypothetical protein
MHLHLVETERELRDCGLRQSVRPDSLKADVVLLPGLHGSRALFSSFVELAPPWARCRPLALPTVGGQSFDALADGDRALGTAALGEVRSLPKETLTGRLSAISEEFESAA